MSRRTKPHIVLVLAILGAIILGGCTLPRRTPAPPKVVAATPLPTFTPTPRPLLTPTPTPVTNLSPKQAQLLVWGQLRSCVEQIADPTQKRVEVAFNSTYSAEFKMWLVEASSPALGLVLGLWEVSDTTKRVTPGDEVARAIVSPGLICNPPPVTLTTGLIPPIFSTPTLSPVVATGEQARLRVWLAVYSCFDPVPPAGSFTAYQDRPGRWIVEGKGGTVTDRDRTGTITYGLWSVDAETGVIIPLDNIAQTTAANTTCYREH